mmetsp:Transcript_22904/g.74613  ORF Transcript_22904/g.74613 Transcript_22904/m.74613 type:complete len:332 (-) Transcript_22904:15-1010(-)
MQPTSPCAPRKRSHGTSSRSNDTIDRFETSAVEKATGTHAFRGRDEVDGTVIAADRVRSASISAAAAARRARCAAGVSSSSFSSATRPVTSSSSAPRATAPMSPDILLCKLEVASRIEFVSSFARPSRKRRSFTSTCPTLAGSTNGDLDFRRPAAAAGGCDGKSSALVVASVTPARSPSSLSPKANLVPQPRLARAAPLVAAHTGARHAAIDPVNPAAAEGRPTPQGSGRESICCACAARAALHSGVPRPRSGAPLLLSCRARPRPRSVLRRCQRLRRFCASDARRYGAPVSAPSASVACESALPTHTTPWLDSRRLELAPVAGSTWGACG